MKRPIHLDLPSDPKCACILRRVVTEVGKISGLTKEESQLVVLAIDEAFTNIIRHTYQMNTEESIRIEITIQPSVFLELVMIDDGPPIKAENVRGRDLDDVCPGGLGVHFIQSAMDEIEYIPGDFKGNKLRLKKYIGAHKTNQEAEVVVSQPELLKTLLSICQSLHQILDLDTLLNTITRNVKDILSCQTTSVMLLDREMNELYFHTVLGDDPKIVDLLSQMRFPANKGIAGRVLESKTPILVQDVQRDPDFFTEVDQNTGGQTVSLLYAPLKVRNRVIGILSAQNKIGCPFHSSDLEIISAIAGTVSLSIDNAQANAKLHQTKRMQKELNAAQIMHKATLPQSIPQIAGVGVAAVCEPAIGVGGDYYDFFHLTPNQHAFAVGDVSGHGLEAGMMVSMVRSCLYTQVTFSHNIEDVMKAMNRTLYGSVQKRLIMTFFFCIYDTANEVFTFSNAGHPPPYYYNAQEDKWDVFNEGDFPLGIMENHRFQTFTKKLRPNDIVVLYSDGIIESQNETKERYGRSRFEKLLSSRKWQNAQDIEKAILDDVQIFAEGCPPADDRTLMVLCIDNP